MKKISFNAIIQKQCLEIIHEVIVIFSYKNDEVDIGNNIHFLIFFSKGLCQQEMLPSLSLSFTYLSFALYDSQLQ